MIQDSDLLRDIVHTIDVEHPLGKRGHITVTSNIQQGLDLRRQQLRRNRKFEERCREKQTQGLYPHWKNNRRFIGWRDTPMARIPDKDIPWWENKLRGMDYKANPWPEAAKTA
jgi:hypothetical protein